MTRTLSKYLTTRSGRYYFRRRIAGLSTKIRPLTIALGTTDREAAFIWLGRLVVEFDRMLDSFVLVTPELPEDLIARYMEICLRQAVSNMTRQNRLARMTGRVNHDAAWRLEMQKKVATILLEDGLRPEFPPARIDPDWSPDELEVVLRIYHAEYQRIMSPAGRAAMVQQFEKVSDLPIQSLEHHAQLREATLKARLAALAGDGPCHQATNTPSDVKPSTPSALVPASGSSPKDVDETPQPLTPGVTLIDGQLTIAALVEQFKQAETQEQTATGAYGRDLAGIFWRMAVQDGLSADVARQRAADLRLFCFVTGIQTIDALEQWHLRRYSDALKQIPKTFLRSNRDQNRSLPQVQQMASNIPSSQVGLAAGTVKRHIKTVELVLARARSEGHSIDFEPDMKALRPKIKGHAHKRRSVFKLDELRQVFAHSLWQGHRSHGRRHDPGSVLRKDSRYWIPLILAYTGARRAEIAGLLPDDIICPDGIAAINIESNPWRGIKGEDIGATDPSEKLTRIVPIHKHLIELGLLDHAQDMRDQNETFLFPDVVPKPRSGLSAPTPQTLTVEKFGEAIDDSWRKSLEIALNGNPRKLCMHSLRHYVNNTLMHNTDVHEVTRLDILGHTHDDAGGGKSAVNTGTYRDDTPMEVKALAIAQLPRLF